jgi:hypothetical protein
MRRNPLCHLGLLAGLGLAGLSPAAQETAAPTEELRPGQPMEVYVAPGRATTVQFHTAEKVAAISLASPVVSYKYDKALNQLEITPAVRGGGLETNLNLRIGPEVYILLVKVVSDVRAQFLRNFTVAGDRRPDDEMGLGRIRPLRPDEIDLVAAARTVERAEVDPIFRDAHPALRLDRLDRTYAWNGCLVTLADLAQFIDRDLLVFRVQWVNRTSDALYLDALQYGLFVGDGKIPITARYKIGVGPVVYPGQLETVFLAVQGYRLSRRNDWQLALPPDAAAVGAMLPRLASDAGGGRPP